MAYRRELPDWSSKLQKDFQEISGQVVDVREKEKEIFDYGQAAFSASISQSEDLNEDEVLLAKNMLSALKRSV